ncbi:MAG: hypothetical protein IT389_14450 [Nitrospira sp.]|nr:hypothetical protein [Nitrospira sp.]
MNYIGLLVWIFIWMFDQARMRGKNVLLWPALFSPPHAVRTVSAEETEALTCAIQEQFCCNPPKQDP